MLANIGIHHFHTRKSSKDSLFVEAKSKVSKLLDDLVYIGGSVGVILALPQLAKIWIGRNVAGLSLVTWVGFLAGTVFWLFYGLVHKVRPIIFINLLYSVINFFIVVGIIAFS